MNIRKRRPLKNLFFKWSTRLQSMYNHIRRPLIFHPPCWKRIDSQKKDVLLIFFIKCHFDVLMCGAQKQGKNNLPPQFWFWGNLHQYNLFCELNFNKKKQFFSFLDFKTTKTIPANTFSSLQFSVLLRNNIHIYTLPKAGETAVPNELTFFVDTHEWPWGILG